MRKLFVRSVGGVALSAGISLVGKLASAQTAGDLPPAIAYQRSPQSIVAVENTAASFSVTATGAAPLSYQWQYEGADLPNRTNRNYALTHAAPGDDGEDRVIVRNAFGAATSHVARLHVVPAPGSLSARVFTNGASRLPYRLFTPQDDAPAQTYPLVLFLHGIGERGADNLRQLSVQPHCLSFVSYPRQKTLPLFFVAPQCPTDRTWSDTSMVSSLGALLQSLVEEFAVDTNRIYITGLSMGGYGCWALLDQASEQIAAAVPICGGGNVARAGVVRGVPIWNFHAADDGSVPISESRNMISALRRAGGAPIYTEYSSGGHGIWPMAYSTPGLVEWVLAQQRNAPAAGGPQLTVNGSTNLCSRTLAAGFLRLSGGASFDSESITSITATNFSNRSGATVAGTREWAIPALALASHSTNTVVVMASSVSRAPAAGGRTMFSQTLFVTTGEALRLQIERGPAGLVLRGSGAAAPFVPQACDDLARPSWRDLSFDSDFSIQLPPSDDQLFFRLVEQ